MTTKMTKVNIGDERIELPEATVRAAESRAAARAAVSAYTDLDRRRAQMKQLKLACRIEDDDPADLTLRQQMDSYSDLQVALTLELVRRARGRR